MAVSAIDDNKCTGCGICVESCPMDVFRLDTIVKERERYSACRLACPLEVRQREYHHLIKLGMLDEAADVMRLCHPMPAITGRLCSHPCESKCVRNDIDQPVNVNGLEEYLGDYLLSLEPPAPSQGKKGKVAVIGSGPAGLAAAYHLTMTGYQVSVFEKENEAGGLLRTAIPAFRLPEDVLDKQITWYKKMGISIQTGIRIGQDLTIEELKKQGYGAFVAATGAAKPIGFSAPGSDAKGIISAVDFLRQVKSGQIRKISGKVAVIGGGSVALDAARSAIRLGADQVGVVCLECLEPDSKDSMLALPEEIEASRAEGVVIYPRTAVSAFEVREGRVSALKCMVCVSVREADGRFNPMYGDSLPRGIEAETIIIATGQTADCELVPDGFAVNDRGFIVADPVTKQVSPGFFAIGDAVSGSSTVVQALASGKRVALTIDRFFRGEDLAAGLDHRPLRVDNPPKEKIPVIDRINRPTMAAEERKYSFQSPVLPLNHYEAHLESQRCLTCGSQSVIAYVDDCQVCRLCQHYCPTAAIEVTEGILLGAFHCWDVVTLGQ